MGSQGHPSRAAGGLGEGSAHEHVETKQCLTQPSHRKAVCSGRGGTSGPICLETITVRSCGMLCPIIPLLGLQLGLEMGLVLSHSHPLTWVLLCLPGCPVLAPDSKQPSIWPSGILGVSFFTSPPQWPCRHAVKNNSRCPPPRAAQVQRLLLELESLPPNPGSATP